MNPSENAHTPRDASYAINALELLIGQSPSATLEINDPSTTVFVGPNNSGKSLVLGEILRACDGRPSDPGKILKRIAFTSFDESTRPGELANIVSNLRLVENPLKSGAYTVLVGSQGNHETLADVKKYLASPATNEIPVCNVLLYKRVLNLGPEQRLETVTDQHVGKPGATKSAVARVFWDPALRAKLRKILFQAFGEYFCVSMVTTNGKLSIHYSSSEPPDGLENTALPPTCKFFENAKYIGRYSHGVRAFTGILLELLAGDPLVVVIDEPEAFLHPSLAATLGRELCKRGSSVIDKNVFVATHSPHFLMGCIQSGSPVNIVRLTFQHGQAAARLLDSSTLAKMMRKPLLRGTGVLEALFADFAVVAEGESDKAFYEEINTRLVNAGDERGIKNCLFLQSYGKDKLHEICGPLRDMGIPCAVIIDVDVCESDDTQWGKILAGAKVRQEIRRAITQMADKLRRSIEEQSIDLKAIGGVESLDAELKKDASEILGLLAEHGVFAVPRGEVQMWLPNLGVEARKQRWLPAVFEAMGDDPQSDTYVSPDSGDVWEFIGKVREWLGNPNRKGMP